MKANDLSGSLSRTVREDAQLDIRRAAKAEAFAKTFLSWFTRLNADHSVEAMPGVDVQRIEGYEVYMFPAARCGLTNLPDLYFGLAHPPRRSETGMLIQTRISGRPAYVITTLFREDPGPHTGVAGKIDLDDLVHEIIHYADIKRGFTSAGNERERRKRVNGLYANANGAAYFNNDLEMNAYYQEAVRKILADVAAKGKAGEPDVLDSYQDFARAYIPAFKLPWIRALSDDNRKRFKKRFYGLYQQVERSWPDLGAVSA